MKSKSIVMAMLVSFFAITGTAQTAIPAKYVKATIYLANGNTINGFIKDNIRQSSSVIFIDESGKNKKQYEGSDINALKTDATNFICIRGDFFKNLSAGKMNFLQKESNSSDKPLYNGTEPIFVNGTPGKIGDYYVFTEEKLTLLNNKTLDDFINTHLTGCTEAVEKAKAINGDMAKMQQVVEIYNAYTLK